MKTNWSIMSIGDVAKPVKRPEEPLPGTKYRQIGVRLWGMGAYERDVLDGAETKYKTLYRVEQGDIIVNKIWARNGSVAVVPAELAGCYASGEFPMFVPGPQSLEPRWFHWITKTKSFWQQCDEKSHGTSGKNRIRPERFLEIEIPLPPLEEQRRIVARIEELAAKVEAARALRQRAVKETESFLPASLRAIFEHLTAEDVAKRSLSDRKLCALVPGQHIMSKDYNTDGYGSPYITGPADFGYKFPEVNKWTTVPKSFSEPGDVLVTVKGAGVGKLNCAPSFSLCIGRQVMALRPNQEQLYRDYLYYYLMNEYDYFQDVARSTTVPGLKREHIWDLAVPLPLLIEQHRIVAYLNDLQAKVEAVKQHQAATAAALDALLPSILDRAFKGEL